MLPTWTDYLAVQLTIYGLTVCGLDETKAIAAAWATLDELGTDGVAAPGEFRIDVALALYRTHAAGDPMLRDRLREHADELAITDPTPPPDEQAPDFGVASIEPTP